MSRLTAVLSLILAVGVFTPAAAQETTVRIKDDPGRDRMVITIGRFDLPVPQADMGHSHTHHGVFPPVGTVEIPVNGYITGFDYEVVDGEGNQLPKSLIHHLNLIDPRHRELFLPISQRMLAVGKETGAHSMPWLLFGYPVAAGNPMVVSAMMHNPTGKPYHDVEVHFYLDYVKVGRPWPLFEVYPFQLDVQFPAGDKSFDLPPGRITRSYEASASMDGKIMVIGAHLHEYAVNIRFEDATEGKLIWEGLPLEDDKRELTGVTMGRLYRKLGARIYADHRYRVSVTYENPTSDTIPSGGMGVVAGVFMPRGGYAWPHADPSNLWYALDRAHYMRWVDTGRITDPEEARNLLATLDAGEFPPAEHDDGHGDHDHPDEAHDHQTGHTHEH